MHIGKLALADKATCRSTAMMKNNHSMRMIHQMSAIMEIFCEGLVPVSFNYCFQRYQRSRTMSHFVQSSENSREDLALHNLCIDRLLVPEKLDSAQITGNVTSLYPSNVNYSAGN